MAQVILRLSSVLLLTIIIIGLSGCGRSKKDSGVVKVDRSTKPSATDTPDARTGDFMSIARVKHFPGKCVVCGVQTSRLKRCYYHAETMEYYGTCSDRCYSAFKYKPQEVPGFARSVFERHSYITDKSKIIGTSIDAIEYHLSEEIVNLWCYFQPIGKCVHCGKYCDNIGMIRSTNNFRLIWYDKEHQLYYAACEGNTACRGNISQGRAPGFTMQNGEVVLRDPEQVLGTAFTTDDLRKCLAPQYINCDSSDHYRRFPIRPAGKCAYCGNHRDLLEIAWYDEGQQVYYGACTISASPECRGHFIYGRAPGFTLQNEEVVIQDPQQVLGTAFTADDLRKCLAPPTVD